MSKQRCPLCEKENNCSMTKSETEASCWCVSETFPKGIFALVPPESKGKHCICRECVRKFQEQSIHN